MVEKRVSEWDDSPPDDEPLYVEVPDSEIDDLEGWTLESHLPPDPAVIESDDRFDRMVERLDEELEKDIGFANEAESLDTLSRMYISDKANYARCEAILRRHKILRLAQQAIKARARQLSNLSPVPGGGESLALVRIKSQLPDAPVPPDSVIPAAWIIDGEDDGDVRYRLIKKVVKRRDGDHYTELVGVAYAPVVISALMTDVDDGSANVRVAWLADETWRHRVVPRQRLKFSQGLIESLSGTHGFPADTNNASDMIQYFTEYEAHNAKSIPHKGMATQMGWQGKAGGLGFIAGKTHVKAHPDARDVVFVGMDEGEDQMSRCVRSAGTMEGWLSSVKIAARFPAVELAIYASLAPVLLPVLRAPNFTIDWSHKTSAGKTTTLSVASSVWGNPDPNARDAFMASWDMTPVGFERRAAALSCLPLIVDDTKRARSYGGQSQVPQVVYAVSNGQGRSRGSVKGTQKTVTWRTVMLSSGEQRIIDFDKSGGTPARVITIWGNPFKTSSQMIAEAIKKLKTGITANFGHAGLAFVRWLVELEDEAGREDIREMHGEMWSNLRDRMIKEAGGHTMDMAVLDRLAGYLATLQITAVCAHKALDLPWELEDPIDELLDQIVPAAGAVDRELEALRMSVLWASQNRQKFIRNDRHRRDSEPSGGWLGYWEAAEHVSWQRLAFFPDSLREFLAKRGFEPTTIIKQWSEHGWLEQTEMGRLSARVNELDDRPRMIVLTRDAVMSRGELDAGGEMMQHEVPF